MRLGSDVKLIRTDSTLDLSQKAKKGMNFRLALGGDIYYMNATLSANICYPFKTSACLLAFCSSLLFTSPCVFHFVPQFSGIFLGMYDQCICFMKLNSCCNLVVKSKFPSDARC